MKYATRAGAAVTLPYMAYESPFGGGAAYPALASKLDADEGRRALSLFRRGQDTVDIARQMDATQFAVANAIARARDEERRAAE